MREKGWEEGEREREREREREWGGGGENSSIIINCKLTCIAMCEIIV